MSFQKKVIFAAVLLIIVALLLSAGIQLHRISRIYSPQKLESLLKETIEGEVSFEEINFSLWTGLQGQQVVVDNAGGHRGLQITAETIKTDVSWTNVIRGKIPAEALEIFGVAVFLPRRVLRERGNHLLYGTPWLETSTLENVYGSPVFDWNFADVEFLLTDPEDEVHDRFPLDNISFSRRSEQLWTGYLGNLQLANGNLAGNFLLDRSNQKIEFRDLNLNFIPPEKIRNLIWAEYDFDFSPYVQYFSGRLEEFSIDAEKIQASGELVTQAFAGKGLCFFSHLDRLVVPVDFELRFADDFLSISTAKPVISHFSPDTRLYLEAALGASPRSRGRITGDNISLDRVAPFFKSCWRPVNPDWLPAGAIDNLDIKFRSAPGTLQLKGSSKTDKLQFATDRDELTLSPAHFIFTGNHLHIPPLQFSTPGITGELSAEGIKIKQLLRGSINFSARASGSLQAFSRWFEFPRFFPADWPGEGELDLVLEFFDFPDELRFGGEFSGENFSLFGFELGGLTGRFSGGEEQLVVDNFGGRLFGGWGGGTLILNGSPEHFDFWSRLISFDLQQFFRSFELPPLVRGEADLQAVISGSPADFDGVVGNFHLDSTEVFYERTPFVDLFEGVNRVSRRLFDENILVGMPSLERLDVELKLIAGRIEIEKVEIYFEDLFLEIDGTVTDKYFQGRIYMHPLSEEILEFSPPGVQSLLEEGFPPLSVRGPLDEPVFNFPEFEQDFEELLGY